jgi:hypothetical protein
MVPVGHSRKVLRTFRDLNHTSRGAGAAGPRVVGNDLEPLLHAYGWNRVRVSPRPVGGGH